VIGVRVLRGVGLVLSIPYTGYIPGCFRFYGMIIYDNNIIIAVVRIS